MKTIITKYKGSERRAQENLRLCGFQYIGPAMLEADLNETWSQRETSVRRRVNQFLRDRRTYDESAPWVSDLVYVHEDNFQSQQLIKIWGVPAKDEKTI